VHGAYPPRETFGRPPYRSSHPGARVRLLRKPSQKPVTDAAIGQAPEVWRKWLPPSLPPRPEAGAFAFKVAHNGWSLAVDNLRQGAGGPETLSGKFIPRSVLRCP